MDDDSPHRPQSSTPWSWIYAAVILFAVAVILALWAFSAMFTP